VNRYLLHACLAALALAVAAAPCRALSGPFGPADFATRVLAYDGTNGAAGYDDPARALGPPSEDALPAVPDNTAVVSFGWGGSLTLGFDRPIENDPRHPGGYDFIVFGNAFYVGGNASATWHVPAYVEVGVDPTGSHAYGDGSAVAWYWLKGDPAPASLTGYPLASADAATNYRGYANNTPTDGGGDPLVPDDPGEAGITEGTAGGDAFDLTAAVDPATGAAVSLPYVDFVRITCAVDGVAPVVGRYHAQVDAVSLVRPRIPGDVDMDGQVTVLDAAHTARAVAGLETLSAEQERRARVTSVDGGPTLSDAAGILRLAAGLNS
jgi:hypothetical protein